MQPTKLVALSQQVNWPDAEKENVMFLGEWCFSEHSPYHLKDINKYNVVKSPYQTGEMTEHLSKLSQTAIKIVTNNYKELNRICNTNHNEVFWQTRLSPWILHWLIMVNEVFNKVTSLPKNETFSTTIFESPKSVDPYMDHSFLTMNYTYWDILVSDVLSVVNQPQITLYRKPLPPHSSRQEKRNLKLVFRYHLKKIYKYFFSSLKIRFGIIESLTLTDRLFLYTKLDPFFWFKQRSSLEKLSSLNKPNFSISTAAKSTLEEVASQLFFRYIPPHFFDQYKVNTNLSIHIGNDIYGTDYDAWSIAKLVELGKTWISYQHGACYGQIKCFSLNYIEYTKNKHFFTWGWQKPHTKSLFTPIPLPSPALAKLQLLPKSNNGDILYISSSRPLFPYRLHTDIAHYDMPKYLNEKFLFLNSLDAHLRDKLKLRPYYTDYQTGEYNLLKKTNIPLLYGPINLDVQMAQSSLIVFDHLGTGLHKAFVMNKPVVAYWDPQHIQIDPNAEPFFTKLKNANILHESADSAAIFINQIVTENKVSAWWNSAQTQEAINSFKSNFCLVDNNWRETWVKTIKNIIHHTPNSSN